MEVKKIPKQSYHLCSKVKMHIFYVYYIYICIYSYALHITTQTYVPCADRLMVNWCFGAFVGFGTHLFAAEMCRFQQFLVREEYPKTPHTNGGKIHQNKSI